MPIVVQKYGGTSVDGVERLRVVWKSYPLPFHKNAPATHAAAHAVFEVGGPSAFWRFHQLTFEDVDELVFVLMPVPLR